MQRDNEPLDPSETPPKPRLALWQLAIVFFFIVALAVTAAAFALGLTQVDGLLDNIAVEVEDVDIAFLDKKKKRIRFGAKTLLAPGKTTRRLRKGYIKATLHVEVRNKNTIDITADRVTYQVDINGIDAGEGEFPGKGKGPIRLPKGRVYEAEFSVRARTRKVVKDPTAIIGGLKYVIKVTGTAYASVAGFPLTRDFSVKKVKQYGLGGGKGLPLPLP